MDELFQQILLLIKQNRRLVSIFKINNCKTVIPRLFSFKNQYTYSIFKNMIEISRVPLETLPPIIKINPSAISCRIASNKIIITNK